jgi:hypothetical protein
VLGITSSVKPPSGMSSATTTSTFFVLIFPHPGGPDISLKETLGLCVPPRDGFAFNAGTI